MGQRCKIILVDNTQANKDAYFTPMLHSLLTEYADVRLVRNAETLRRAISDADGIVTSGSQHTLSEHISEDVLTLNAIALHSSLPVLGICFGMQIMALLRGGKLERLDETCKGIHRIHVDPRSMLLKGDNVAFDTYHEHDDAVTVLPKGYDEIAWLEEPKHHAIVAFENKKTLHFGVQFHPESQRQTTSHILVRFVNMCSSVRGTNRRRHILSILAVGGILLEMGWLIAR